MIQPLITAAVLALPLPVLAGSLCVGNKTAERLMFAVESKVSGERVLSELAPQKKLCIETPDSTAKGVVSVFASLEAEEGCSRLVEGAEAETLIAYAEFERCEWSSHKKN